MKILCFGSLNIDQVFTVPHIVKEGETIHSTQLQVFPGGKGANQSCAIAKAGSPVCHAGTVGTDGTWLLDNLSEYGVDTSLCVVHSSIPTGRAIIQLSDSSKDNAIVLLQGTNYNLSLDHVKSALSGFQANDWLVLQNEIHPKMTEAVIRGGREKGMILCLNPSPFPSDIGSLLPNLIDILILNETESQAMLGRQDTDETSIKEILTLYSNLNLVLITKGKHGVVCGFKQNSTLTVFDTPVKRPVKVVDTTGAGDTFVGFFVSSLFRALNSKPISECTLDQVKSALSIAVLASGVACESKGAMTSIPTLEQINSMI